MPGTVGRWVGAVAVFVALVAPLVVMDPNPAGACSCYPPVDLARVLPEAEGAFIGRLIGRRKARRSLTSPPMDSAFPGTSTGSGSTRW